MRNERGKIKLITAIGIVFVLAVILFALVTYKQITKNNEKIEEPKNVIGGEIAKNENEIENKVTEEKEDNQTTDDFSMKFLQLENNQKNIEYY